MRVYTLRVYTLRVYTLRVHTLRVYTLRRRFKPRPVLPRGLGCLASLGPLCSSYESEPPPLSGVLRSPQVADERGEDRDQSDAPAGSRTIAPAHTAMHTEHTAVHCTRRVEAMRGAESRPAASRLAARELPVRTAVCQGLAAVCRRCRSRPKRRRPMRRRREKPLRRTKPRSQPTS